MSRTGIFNSTMIYPCVYVSFIFQCFPTTDFKWAEVYRFMRVDNEYSSSAAVYLGLFFRILALENLRTFIAVSTFGKAKSQKVLNLVNKENGSTLSSDSRQKGTNG